MANRHIALGLPLNPTPPPSDESYLLYLGWRSQGGGQTSKSGHGGGPLGSGEGNTFQDCGRPSINWYNGKIIDTGNPDANYFPTAPGQFNRMGQVYANNNVTITNGVTAIIPAQNGIATGLSGWALTMVDSTEARVGIIGGTGIFCTPLSQQSTSLPTTH